jgi:hypothetical protein
MILGNARCAGISGNDNNHHDGRAGLSWIEIYVQGFVQGKPGALIVTKGNYGGCSVLQKSHERDLNCSSNSIQDISELNCADRPLDCRSWPNGTANEYIAATNRE